MLQPATKEQLLDQSVVMSDAWTILKKYANIDMNAVQNEITRLSMKK